MAGRGCLWLCISSTHLSHHLQATVECSYADGIHAKRISSFSSSVYIMYTNPLLVQEGSSVIISGHNPSSVQSCHSRTCLKSFLPHPWWQGLCVQPPTIMMQHLLLTDPQTDPVPCTFAKFILSIPYNNSVRVALSVDSAMPNTGASFTQYYHAVNANIFISANILKTSPEITDTASGRTRFQFWEQTWQKLVAMRRR